ncbi:MAG: flagellar hook-length control protein FliK [Nitrospiraceae bacterium]|nr:flagellar hook-length control protein FliK [Nitrospiraceae bacterium]
MQGNEGGILSRLFSDPDLKGLLLKFRELLKDETIEDSLRSSGRSPAAAANVVDRLIKNIEFFQLTSQIHDVFYTFLPVSWGDLRDGELTLREGRSGEDRSYTCDITLELESVGRLSVSVTLFGGAFNVSFHAERADTASLLDSGKGDLEKRFRDSGLPLRIVNVGRRTAINFRVIKPRGFDARV